MTIVSVPCVVSTHILIRPFHQSSGLGDATDIVIGGCSAGAIQTYINLDYIKSLMPETAHVVGLPDSGCVASWDWGIWARNPVQRAAFGVDFYMRIYITQL